MHKGIEEKRLYLFAGLAAIGLFLSVMSHLATLAGFAEPLGNHAWLLHPGIFIVWFPAILVAQRLTRGAPRDRFWEIALRGCPSWMKYMVYGFFVYALVNFLFFVLSIELHKPPTMASMPPLSIVRGFSAHWMAFYSAAFAILYSGAASPGDRSGDRR
jgi:hypothetical protein